LHSTLSRRAADEAIARGRVLVNNAPPQSGQDIHDGDVLSLDGKTLEPGKVQIKTIMLNKPRGYVVSRDGQGSATIYDLLPPELHNLKPVGRLDKYSSGLLLLTNDGDLAQKLTHPSYQKEKIYQVRLDKPLTQADIMKIQKGVELDDGLSRLGVKELAPAKYQIIMTEGRNRQIRRTFEALSYNVIRLHRTNFGPYKIDGVPVGEVAIL
jgi:23S rRNA pseudouridine2605 synthase